MSTPCTHPRTGIVTSHKPKLGLFEAAVHGAHAEAPVCDLPECIAEATAWVVRMSRKQAHHVPDHIPQVEVGGEGDAQLGLAGQAVTEDGQQGLGPARPALSDSPNGGAS